MNKQKNQILEMTKNKLSFQYSIDFIEGLSYFKIKENNNINPRVKIDCLFFSCYHVYESFKRIQDVHLDFLSNTFASIHVIKEDNHLESLESSVYHF
jgi:hypothetical protein